MYVEIYVSAESLDEGDGAGFEISYFVIWVFFVKAKLHGFLDASCDDRVREPQDFPLEFGIPGAHVAKWHRHREHPLANDGACWKYVVSEVRSSFGHSPCSATSAKSSFFAAEGDEALVFAIYATEAQESVSQHSALEEGLEFFRHMQWKVFALFAAKIFEAAQVFLHDFVEECAFGAAPDIASIVPRKGCLPVRMGMRTLRMPLALLLHNTPTLQSWGHGCSATLPCRS
jgi:hypothetical protein